MLGWYWCSYNAIELGRETQKRLLVITPPERMLFNTINQVCSDLLLINCRWAVKHIKMKCFHKRCCLNVEQLWIGRLRKNQLQLQQLPQNPAQLLSAYTLHSHTEIFLYIQDLQKIQEIQIPNTRYTNTKYKQITLFKKIVAATVAVKSGVLHYPHTKITKIQEIQKIKQTNTFSKRLQLQQLPQKAAQLLSAYTPHSPHTNKKKY